METTKAEWEKLEEGIVRNLPLRNGNSPCPASGHSLRAVRNLPLRNGNDELKAKKRAEMAVRNLPLRNGN